MSWAVSTAAWAVFLAVAPSRTFLYDSARYWRLKDTYGSVFSLLDYRDELRGYAFPWLLRIESDLLRPITTNPDLVVRALSLMLVPLLLSVLVPTICQRVSPATRLTVSRILLLNLLFFLFWRNDLLYPLSDLPAFALMAGGVLLLLRSDAVAASAGAGAAFGLAVNFRNAYLLAAATALALLFLLERRPKRVVARMAAIIVGTILVLMPQTAINLKHFDRLSPLPVASSDLGRLQLMAGIQLDRYETYVGSDERLDPSGMRFENRALNAVVGPDRTEFDSFGEYGGFVWDHPADVTVAYLRQLFNGLDVGFDGTYIEDVRSRGVAIPLVNYLVIALALAWIGTRWMRRRSVRWTTPSTWVLAVLVAACVPGIIGAVEARFLLPLHLALLAAFALCASWSDLPARGKRRTAIVGLVGGFVAVSFALSADTMGSLIERPLRIDGALAPARSPDRSDIALGPIRATPAPKRRDVPCVALGWSPLLASGSKTLLSARDRDVNVRLRRFGREWITIDQIPQGDAALVDIPAIPADKATQPWMLQALGACRVRSQPAATIIVPNPGAHVHGTVPLVATSPNVYPIKVEFRLSGEGVIDQTLGVALPSFGWALDWDSTSVPNGLYELTCVVVDTAGNSDVSTPVRIEVAN